MIINSYIEQYPEDYRQSPETGIIQQIQRIGSERILDIGCGSGKQCYVLSNNAREVIGIDLQQFMIDHAKMYKNKENIKYICDDFINVELNENYFDIILSQNVMFHVKNKRKFLEKIYKLLIIGGQFVFTDLTIHCPISSPENLAFPVQASYYSKVLNEIGFTNILFLWEKHWIWDGVYSGNNYCMFKCSK